MTHPKSLIPTEAKPHLSVDELYQYLEGKLPLAASHEVEQHLLDCDLCADALDGLAQVPQAEAEHAVFDINRHLKKRTSRPKKNSVLQDVKNWGLIAAILFLLIFSSLVVWFQVNQTKTSPQRPAAPAKTVAPLTSPRIN